MLRRTTLAAAIVVAATLAFALPVALADQPGPSVTGSGQTTVGGFNRTFTVSAQQAADGSVSGQSEVQSRETDNIVHIDINCMVISGNIAYLSGVITKSTNAALVGDTGVLSVQDNHGAGPDMISLGTAFPPGSGTNCTNNQPPPTVPVEHGNITIHR